MNLNKKLEVVDRRLFETFLNLNECFRLPQNAFTQFSTENIEKKNGKGLTLKTNHGTQSTSWV